MNRVLKETILNDIGRSEAQSVYVGNSGCFELEKFIVEKKKSLPVFGSDFRFSSVVLGDFLCGNELKVKIKHYLEQQFRFINDYFKTDLDKVSTIILFSKLHARQKTYINSFKFELNGFFNLSNRDLLNQLDDNAIVIINKTQSNHTEHFYSKFFDYYFSRNIDNLLENLELLLIKKRNFVVIFIR